MTKLYNFSREIKVVNRYKVQNRSIFTQNNSTLFLGKSKLNFWTKSEDFERCECNDAYLKLD